MENNIWGREFANGTAAIEPRTRSRSLFFHAGIAIEPQVFAKHSENIFRFLIETHFSERIASMAKLSTKAVLSEIRNWEELAGQAKYHCGELAKLCGVSDRALDRFFLQQMGVAPQKWLGDTRHYEAERLARTGMRTKEIANSLGYSCPACFCRDFRKRTGQSPRMLTHNCDRIRRTLYDLAEISKMSEKANQLVLSP